MKNKIPIFFQTCLTTVRTFHADNYLFAPVLLCTLYALSLIAINLYFFQFPGNAYCTGYPLDFFLFLMLTTIGSALYFDRNHYATKVSYELTLYFIVLLSIELGCTAIQYTPFHPIDQHLLNMESMLGIDFESLVIWVNQHPFLQLLLYIAYHSLGNQLLVIPLILIAFQKTETLRPFYYGILISAVIGFTIYYFFPTIAPASTLQSPWFTDRQYATGLKFYDIHHYIPPSTTDGGMIAFPSFHVIWAWLILCLIKPYRIAWYTLLPVNTLLVFGCVLLGWHYPFDVLGSVFVIVLTHIMHRSATKRRKARTENHACI